MTLVEFECGCIGFNTDDKSEAVILIACDSPDGEHSEMFHVREMRSHLRVNGRMVWTPKACTELTPEHTADVISRIANLINDGQNLRDLKRILR